MKLIPNQSKWSLQEDIVETQERADFINPQEVEGLLGRVRAPRLSESASC